MKSRRQRNAMFAKAFRGKMLWRAVCVMTGHVCRKSVPQRRKNWKSRAKRGQQTDVGLPTGRGGYGKTLAETMLACGLRFACCRISNSGVAIRSTERNRGEFLWNIDVWTWVAKSARVS